MTETKYTKMAMLLDAKDSALDRLLNLREVAEFMNCGKRTIPRLVDSGVMPQGMKIGGLRRWSLQILQQWVADGCPDVRRTNWQPGKKGKRND